MCSSDLDYCPKWLKMTATERGDLVRRKNVCLICLRHSKDIDCWTKKKEGGPNACGQYGCKEKHHPQMHAALKKMSSCRLVEEERDGPNLVELDSSDEE